MGLEESGVRLIAEGAAAFNRALEGANAASARFGKTLSSVTAPAMKALSQVAIGALRELGAFATRGLVYAGREALRFAENLLQASLKGSQFEQTSQDLYASLVAVTSTSLGPFFEQLGKAAENAAPKLLGVVQVAEEYLGGLASQALGWGEGVASSFADGLINGAVWIINALADLAATIAYWLMPGSPPRLLPNLDQWGAGAAEAWAAGWGKADFGTFNELAGTVEAALRAGSRGKDTGLIPAILGSRDALAAAVAQVRQAGVVTQGMLDGVFAQLGPTTQAMQDYVAATLRLELANKAVSDLEAQFQGLSDAQQQLIDEGKMSQLEFVLKDPNATAREKEIARLEIEKLKTGGALTQAKKEQAAAQAVFDTAKARVQMETETNALLKEQLNLLDALAEKMDKLGGGAKAGGGKAGGGVARFKPDLAWLDGLVEKFAGPLANLQAKWGEAWDAMKVAIQPFVDFVKKEIGIHLPTIMGNLEASLKTLEQIWRDHKNEIMLVAHAIAFGVQFAFETVVVAGLSLVTIASGVLLIALTTVKGIMDGLTKAMKGDWQGMWDAIKITNDTNTAILANTFGVVITGILTLFGTDIDTAKQKFVDFAVGMIVNAGLVAVAIVTNFNAIKTYLSDRVPDFIQIGKDLAAGVATGILMLASEIAAAAAKLVADAIAAARAALGNPQSPSPVTFKLLGLPFGQGIAAGILASVDDVTRAAGVSINAAISPPASAGQIGSRSVVNNSTQTFQYAPQYTTAPRPPQADYAIWRTLIGSNA